MRMKVNNKTISIFKYKVKSLKKSCCIGRHLFAGDDDGDGIPDHLDNDDDGDGIPDIDEGNYTLTVSKRNEIRLEN